MVLKAMEETQESLEEFVAKYKKQKSRLTAELEELSIRNSEIVEATDIFENTVVIQGLDKLTQRIPAEKFIRFMVEWLKSAQFSIEKIRLRSTSIKNQLAKLCILLIQREEMGENIRAVDFDKIRIDNEFCLKSIEEKNQELLNLKQMTGGSSLVLTTHKKHLQKQIREMETLQKSIATKKAKVQDVEKECVTVQVEIEKAQKQYDNITYLTKSYTVPDVMEYVRIKSKLYDLKKNIKIRNRRKNIQDIALNACATEMKNLTGSPVIKPSWFKFNESNSTTDLFYFKM